MAAIITDTVMAISCVHCGDRSSTNRRCISARRAIRICLVATNKSSTLFFRLSFPCSPLRQVEP